MNLTGSGEVWCLLAGFGEFYWVLVVDEFW